VQIRNFRLQSANFSMEIQIEMADGTNVVLCLGAAARAEHNTGSSSELTCLGVARFQPTADEISLSQTRESQR
jgi:hypothetical protein